MNPSLRKRLGFTCPSRKSYPHIAMVQSGKNWRGDPRQFSAGQSDYDQNIKQLKAEGRNHEQVDGRDVRRMVTQEGAPPLRERPASLRHILGDGRLRDRKAELEQLTMNTRRAPKQVLNAHPPDQRPQISSDLRLPTKPATGTVRSRRARSTCKDRSSEASISRFALAVSRLGFAVGTGISIEARHWGTVAVSRAVPPLA